MCTRRVPTSKIAFHASAVDPLLSYVKNAHRSASPVHVGVAVLKSTVTFWSTSTSGWPAQEEHPVNGLDVGVTVGVFVAGNGVGVLDGVFVGVRVGVIVFVGVEVLVGVRVGVMVAVLVGVRVGVEVFVLVGVLVGVGVGPVTVI